MLSRQARAAAEVMACSSMAAECCATDPTGPGVAAMISSGHDDQVIATVKAFEAAGVEGVSDCSPGCLLYALRLCLKLRVDQEVKVRSLGSALAFCLENPLEIQPGHSTNLAATQLCKQTRSQVKCTQTQKMLGALAQAVPCSAGMKEDRSSRSRRIT